MTLLLELGLGLWSILPVFNENGEGRHVPTSIILAPFQTETKVIFADYYIHKEEEKYKLTWGGTYVCTAHPLEIAVSTCR